MQQHVPDDRKPAAQTTPVESETTDEFQPAYGRGGAVRSDEPERDWFFEEGAAAARTRKAPVAPETSAPETSQAPSNELQARNPAR